MRVPVKPELLRWACKRSRRTKEYLLDKFPKYELWEAGEVQPTLRQLESFAKKTNTSIGYFFLPTPPVESVPIPDYRTIGNAYLEQPGPDLLDTIYLCQQRQEWYRDYTRSIGGGPLHFAGTVRVSADVEATAASMRHVLGFDLEERRRMPTWSTRKSRLARKTFSRDRP